MHQLKKNKLWLVWVVLPSIYLAACQDQANDPNESSFNGSDSQVSESTVADAQNTTSETVPVVAQLPDISSTLPTVVTFGSGSTLKALQHDFDEFSWQSFIALNWPADAQGNADTSISIGDKPGAKTVWQNYKESRDIFLPNGAQPPAWNEENPAPPSCTGSVARPVLNQVGKTPNVLDESGEPFKTGPLIDQNGLYTRFEILTNEVMFDYIVNNGLYSKAGQSAYGQDADFPISTDDTWGAIMIKASWKVIGANDDATKFHTTNAYVYNNPDENAGVEAACTLEKVGLVGLHIGTKVDGALQWVWSTFEHIDNAPTQTETASKAHYNYYNPSCTDCQVNEPPARPWNPAVPTTPSQIERVIPIDDETKSLNVSYQAALDKLVAGSVWVNYELVSTQWPTVAPNQQCVASNYQCVNPTGTPAPSFLANTTLESYIQGSVPQTSSSCIHCHNNSAMTNGKFSDFTYLLQRAQ